MRNKIYQALISIKPILFEKRRVKGIKKVKLGNEVIRMTKEKDFVKFNYFSEAEQEISKALNSS